MAKYCAHCGKKINDNALFCKYCGAKADVEETTDAEELAIMASPNPSEKKPADEKLPKKMIAVIAVAIALVVVTAAVGAVMYFGKTDDTVTTSDTGVEESNEPSEVEDIASKNTQSVEAKKQSIMPLMADASSQHDDMGDFSYPPGNAIDGDLTTAWVEGADGEGKDEWISVTFNNEKPIKALCIRNGYQKSEEAYTTNNRVKDALVEFDDGSVEKFTLKDMNNTEQIVVLSKEKESKSIRIIIQSAYLSPDEVDTCITEIGILESGMDYPSESEVVYAKAINKSES